MFRYGSTEKAIKSLEEKAKGGFICGYCNESFDSVNESFAFNHDSDSALCDRRRKNGL